MAPISKKRTDQVGQIEGMLTILDQLGIPSFSSDPTGVVVNGSVPTAVYYNTVDKLVKVWNGTGWDGVFPADQYYTKDEVDSEMLGKVDVSTANQPNGWLQLGPGGVADPSQLPSFTSEVQEVANFAALPAPGIDGVIYITLDENLQYRWGGSAYVQLVPSPGSSDAVPEGSQNLYLHTSTVSAATRVLGVLLSAISFGTASAVLITDTLGVAVGKLQAQITALLKVPTGGATGTALIKNSATAGDYSWAAYQNATESQKGVIALASIAEAIAGTDDAKAVTALKVLSAILDNQKNIRYGVNPISVQEVTVLMENAGSVLSVLSNNVTSVKLKTGYSGTYPVGSQTYPFAYAANDVVVVTYTYSDPNNLRGNVKLICRDN
jgi:hypothetical protein